MPTSWLGWPIKLHAWREYECTLNTTEECAFEQGYWRFWYEADHRYALPTVALFTSTIVLFASGWLAMQLTPLSVLRTPSVKRFLALCRYASYRRFRIERLNWNSASVGVLFLGAVGTLYFFCMTLAPKPYYWPNTSEVDYGSSPPIATRSGWMSLACLPFVIMAAGKSNWITLVTGISHENLQVFHRWISYAMFVTALVHTFPFIVYGIQSGMIVMNWNTSVFWWTGVIALLAQTWLTFASFAPLRSLSYEFFKLTHFLAALIFVIFLFFHCDYTLSSWDYLIVTATFFTLSWAHRYLRVFVEYGFRRASVSLEPNGFVRITVPHKSGWTVGQHYFVRLAGLGAHALSVHPFTACSLPDEADSTNSRLIFYIRPRGGFTAHLAKYAKAQKTATIGVLLDGPYGGVDLRKLWSAQRMLVVAGGSGAGWILPFVIELYRRLATCPKAAPSMRVILATRDLATQCWFETAIREILLSDASGRMLELVSVEVYLTGSEAAVDATGTKGQLLRKLEDPEKAAADVAEDGGRTSSDVSSSKHHLQPHGFAHHTSRPSLLNIVSSEAHSASVHGSVGVFVCGPLSMQKDVADAVAKQELEAMRSGKADIYLHLEHFSWA
ncbi:hypothetical protein BAUCODRAFT_156963 [Baudoinia panamericana UAMH 10762]|uniref:ferric-chelate reductase (NADPH) n=1 Tax=Baudoinia panamericana (strain UAMH 10762) TaxID=717646 RepID=M2MFY3_BAUPA|nr:uncharacterized protein BAUCODRAFT_156963 [Baudoinia panamericana UAMH 10762]EMC95526.1 hypothetical protein BAUCODRAFT_156963 [Baudoinia panamericana UAMH 10762]